MLKIVNDQGTEIENMKETIQRQEAEIGQLKYDKNRQGIRIKKMENDFGKQVKLQTGNEISKLQTDLNQGNENEHNGSELEDIAESHNMKWNGTYFNEYSDRKGNEETTNRNGKTNLQGNDKNYFNVEEKNNSAEKRMLSPVSQTNVAFSAYLSYAVSHMGIGHTIKPDKIYLNDGNSYNTHTGVFTVPRTGIYLLTFTVDSYYLGYPVEVGLVVDSVSMGTAKATSQGSNHHVQATKVFILHLNAGQSVWLQTFYTANATISSHSSDRFVTFSGVFLY